MAELGLADTNGILRLPWVRPDRSSAGLGWSDLYVSTQSETPYRASFDAAGTHLVILHLGGPVTVRRGRDQVRRIQAGGLFMHPAGRDLTVELGGPLDTVHAYLSAKALPGELNEELGTADPLVEQLMLTLDGVVRQWEPAARTYVDHLTGLFAAHLAHHYSPARTRRDNGRLSEHQLAAAKELMTERLAEPIPLTDLAAAAALSVSQFTRRFKAATGEPPHRYLMRLRVEQACRLLRAEGLSIPEIAVRCGFTHQEHLTRVMRTRLGTTPAAYRRGI
ncbi:AraC family transcriptional regulator [Amycolatopsis acidiphila]|uniref:Helix-turn-helix transcriptional regulator n=1 Tax=Amycolatopsis acidiphila TaxID=715473 RepID=A0A558AAE9_9PSEU|nr:AraC family transcriptional regulator [Amycolatopsis acidiphila]TVT21238.1 helix-turn-helix transcriptional regulator [Amycolatopsis acidiphila]UIJ61255.1 AraC family transcriptional regulator [Amycolatopsis acidiphila]GHG78563.1 AraC family transcriptional regulator [Amycolatopsis acidiphila]